MGAQRNSIPAGEQRDERVEADSRRACHGRIAKREDEEHPRVPLAAHVKGDGPGADEKRARHDCESAEVGMGVSANCGNRTGHREHHMDYAPKAHALVLRV